MIYIRIKEERLRLKLTQEEMALKLDLATSSYALYEQNRRNPDYKTLSKMADLFGCSVDYLLGRVSNRKEVLTKPNAEEALHIVADNAKIPPNLLREYIQYLKDSLKK